MLDLKDLRTLKKLTLSHNPWYCKCDILSNLPRRVMDQLDNTAMMEALLAVKCAQPDSFQGRYLTILNHDDECPADSNMFEGLVACLIVLFIFVMIVYYSWKQATKRSPLSPITEDATQGRKYDVMVVHANQDYELVKREIIGPLLSLGYSVAWHDTAFPPGEWICASVEQAVRNSRRMLVVATENLICSNWVKFEIRRGHHEELDVHGFKVTAIVMNNLPRRLPRDIYTLIAERIHIVHGNSDYLKKLQEFLPKLNSNPLSNNFNSSDAYLNQILEDLQRRRTQTHAPLSEVFSAHWKESRVSISIDIPNPAKWTETMINKFKTRPEVVVPRQFHTISNEYALAECFTDEEEVSQLEGFVRNIAARRTWPAAGTSDKPAKRFSPETQKRYITHL